MIGTQLEFSAAVQSHNLDGVPAANRVYPGGVPCVVRLTVTYTGGEPGGVSAWDAAASYQEAPGVPYVGELPSQKAFAGGIDVPMTSDGSSGLQFVSSTTSELVVDCYLGYDEKPAGGAWDYHPELTVGISNLITVTATRASDGGTERLSTIIGCNEQKLIEFAGSVAQSNSGFTPLSLYNFGYQCPPYHWEVVDRRDAGPFTPGVGAAPSASGQMVTLKLTGCHGGTPVLDPFPAAPWHEAYYETGDGFPRRELGEDCCTLTTDEVDHFYPYAAGVEPNDLPLSGWDMTEPRSRPAPDYVALTVAPPRAPNPPWERQGKVAPLTRIRWPIYLDTFGNQSQDPDDAAYDWEATGDDADHGTENAARVVYHEVFFGECSRYLTETPTAEWDFEAAPTGDAEASLAYQSHALLQRAPYEMDLGDDSTEGDDTPTDQSRAHVVGVQLKRTDTACDDCCGCDRTQIENFRYIYIYTGEITTLSRSIDRPGDPGDPPFVPPTDPYTDTYTYWFATAAYSQRDTDWDTANRETCMGDHLGVHMGNSGYGGPSIRGYYIDDDGNLGAGETGEGDWDPDTRTQIDYENLATGEEMSLCIPSDWLVARPGTISVPTGEKLHESTFVDGLGNPTPDVHTPADTFYSSGDYDGFQFQPGLYAIHTCYGCGMPDLAGENDTGCA